MQFDKNIVQETIEKTIKDYSNPIFKMDVLFIQFTKKIILKLIVVIRFQKF